MFHYNWIYKSRQQAGLDPQLEQPVSDKQPRHAVQSGSPTVEATRARGESLTEAAERTFKKEDLQDLHGRNTLRLLEDRLPLERLSRSGDQPGRVANCSPACCSPPTHSTLPTASQVSGIPVTIFPGKSRHRELMYLTLGQGASYSWAEMFLPSAHHGSRACKRHWRAWAAMTVTFTHSHPGLGPLLGAHTV